MLDFQIATQKFSQKDLKVAQKYINESLNSIQKLKYSSKINQIAIE